MAVGNNISDNFQQGLVTLGFENDDALYLIEPNHSDPEIRFHLDKAQKDFNATAVYLRKQLNGSYKPQVYLFDFTDKSFSEENQGELTKIQKEIWSSGEAPLACIFYNTEIKILNCTTAITGDYKPIYLIKDLKLAGAAHKLYNQQFAIKIKSGLFWEEETNKKNFQFKNSSYERLIENIGFLSKRLKEEYSNIEDELINKIIVQSILIKYLEERIDSDGKKLLSDKFFKKYDKAITFNDVLRKGKFVHLLQDLNDPIIGFNGNIFLWQKEEQDVLNSLDLNLLADLLGTKKVHLASLQQELNFPDWRYFEFKYIPVELISRLYEEFLAGSNEEATSQEDKKKEDGIYYTPSHLAKLLVDECLPLKKFNEIDLSTYTVLDPACGSGIFLVIVFKRLVQIWRLQNEMRFPSLKILKTILKNIYGVDKEGQAINLASFSLCLALCNELEPLEIITKLKFDDLKEENLIQSDFFVCDKIKDKKFDLIIGNPPFYRGLAIDYSQSWEFEGANVDIPQGQIALKFLSDSLVYLKESGLQCLIIKSSGLLYNSTSDKFKELLFTKLNVIQILDFTALARNKSLWDNGADVASAAIFIKSEKADFRKNILHLVFRRTKASIERIVFEIDEYDLHFVNRQTAIQNSFIWKINLLGGGRVKGIIEKVMSLPTLAQYLKENNCSAQEGYIISNVGILYPAHIYKIPTLPTSAISEEGIDYSQLKEIDKEIKFKNVPPEIYFKAPNILIWENIGKIKLPVFFNEVSFSFKDKIISIASKIGDSNFLKSIVNSFEKYSDFYRFYIYVTSSQVLINLNTAILKKDFMQLRFIGKEDESTLSEFDFKIISDVNNYLQEFNRHGETSKAVKPINKKEFNDFFINYGNEFSKILNLIYEDNNKKFRLSDVVTLDNSFIATVFKYDSTIQEPSFHTDNSKLKLKELTDLEISKQLTVNRIIKLYPAKDTIVFIKPNQYRYWLSLIAYRDADKCFADLSKAGY
jgi:methylase of polypeptide subunit release factors